MTSISKNLDKKKFRNMSKLIKTSAFITLTIVLSVLPCIAQTTAAPGSDEQLSSVYQTKTNHYISISPMDFGDGKDKLTFLNFETGRFGLLQYSSANAFVSGAGLFSPPSPVDVQIKFAANEQGKAASLAYNQNGTAEIAATRINLKQEEVKFQNGDVTLAGTLTMPATKGKHPAVVLVHGSGPARRGQLNQFANFFAAQGCAVLSFDKRSYGASTGKFPFSFDDLAGDVLAGVQFLKNRKEIKPRQIGLWSVSQGGWIAPLAASRSKDVAFLIIHAGSAVSPAANDLLNAAAVLRADGFSEADVKNGVELRRLQIEYARTGEGWDAFKAAAERGRKEKWFSYVRPPETKDDVSWQARRLIQDYNPTPVLERLRIPVLAFFGEVDREVPIERNKEAMERDLRRAGNKDYTIIVLPKANHIFLEAETGGKKEQPRLNRFVPQYFETMAAWLRKRAKV